MTRNEDADDPYVPLLIWWAIEEQIDNAAKEVLALLDDPNAWMSRLFSRSFFHA